MDTADALQARITEATQKDVLLGIFFESSIAALQQSPGAAVAEAVRSQIFGKRSVVSFFRYPVADLLRLVDLGVQKRNATRRYHEAVVEFGRAAVRHFFDSPVGKTMALLAGDNIQRLLQSAPSGYKAVVSFGNRTYERVSDRSARIEFQGDLLGPGWQQGVIEAAIEATSKVKAKVRMEVKNPAATDFTAYVEW